MGGRTSWHLEWNIHCFSNRLGLFYLKHLRWQKCLRFLLFLFDLSVSVALISVLAAVGICERCRVESGGVYFLIAHTLGKHKSDNWSKMCTNSIMIILFLIRFYLSKTRISFRWISRTFILLWTSRWLCIERARFRWINGRASESWRQ